MFLAALRLGKDVMILSKDYESKTVALVSLSMLKDIAGKDTLIPIVSWSLVLSSLSIPLELIERQSIPT